MASVDDVNFLAGLNAADRKVASALNRAAAELSQQVEKIGKEEVPVAEGTLAGTIFADTDNVSFDGQIVQCNIFAGGGEASDYAIYQHDRVLHHTHPVVGEYASEYMQKGADAVSKVAAPFAAQKVKAALGGKER